MRAATIAAAIGLAGLLVTEAPVAVASEGETVTNFSAQRTTGRTRVIVRKRSYLDGGTEVLPGERKYHDYVYPPNYSPLNVLGPGQGFNDRQYGLPSPWDIPRMGGSFY